MHVQMAVVEIDVPAEDAGDERERVGQVDQLAEGRVARDEAEQVQRSVGRQPPGRGPAVVGAVDDPGQPADGLRAERAGDGDEAVPVKGCHPLGMRALHA